VGNFLKNSSLASGKGRKKPSVFPPAQVGRLCRISAPNLARAWGIAIPIKVVDAPKARFELLAATAKLALYFPPISLRQQNKKIIRVVTPYRAAIRIFLYLQFVNIL
jgi:hypothetical protein